MLPDGTNNQQQQQQHGQLQVAASAAATGSMQSTNHPKGAIIQPKSQQQRLNQQGSCNQETKNTMIDQQQTTNNNTTVQLVQSPTAKPIQQLQLNPIGQFNYNPLYMSSHDSAQAHLSGSRDDKTDAGANTDTSSLNQEEEDVLDDIYQYSASSMQQQQQQQQDFDHAQQRNQSSASANSDDHCDRSAINRRAGGRQQQQQPMDGLRRIKQQTPALYSTDQVPLIHHHGHTNAPFGDGISSPLNGTTRQIMRKSNPKGNEIDRTKRVSAMNHSIAGFNSQSQLNFQYQQQQQQFMITATGGHQLDPVEECNGGLFVEYQTNRNGPLGGLEELHSLNVTNCDSETLEEHMNMLSGEDCFATGDDLQDFAIGSTNDHFLNMLTLGSNGESGVTTGTNLMNSSQNSQTNDGLSTIAGQQFSTGQQHSIEAAGQQPTMMRTMIAKIDSEQQQQQHHDLGMDDGCQLNVDKKLAAGNGSTGKSFNNRGKEASSKCDETTTKRPRARKRAPMVSDGQPMAGFARGVDASTKAAAAAVAAALQDKITTTNTNKRLLPNKRGNIKSVDQLSGKRKGNSSGSWMSSPNSSSASTNSSFSGLSPSSSSQLDIIETPYRQQLENLKKKLKMDAPPLLIAASEQAILDGRLEDQANQAPSTQQQQQQQSYLSMETNPTSVNGIVVSSQGGNCILTTTNTTAKQQQQQQQQQPCAYVIARHIDPNQGFDASPGTIYLRTSNGGLVHLNSDRRSGLPAVVSIGQSDADYSLPATGPANSASSIVISCAAGPNQEPNGVADGQPQQQQHYMTAASTISTRGPAAASIVFHPNQQQQQQQRHADETLIMSTSDLDGIQTLLIPSGGPAPDDLDNPSLKHHNHHHHHHHHNHHHHNHHHQNQHHHHTQKQLIQQATNSGDSSSSSPSSLMSQSLFSGPVILQTTADQLVGQSAIL